MNTQTASADHEPEGNIELPVDLSSAERFIEDILSGVDCLEIHFFDDKGSYHEIEFDAENVERDEEELFCVESDARSVDCKAEDAIYTNSLFVEIRLGGGRTGYFAGTHCLGEYNDDESDASISGSLYLPKPNCTPDAARSAAIQHHNDIILLTAEHYVKKASDLLKVIPGEMASKILDNRALQSLLRSAAMAR